MTKIKFRTHPDFPLPIPDEREEVLALLDKYFPNSTDQIDVDNLYMTNSSLCLFGQTIGWGNVYEMFRLDYNKINFFSAGSEAWQRALTDYRIEKYKNTPVPPAFNLKTQPWFIKTETPEERIAAQEWLFSQGMEWGGGGQGVMDHDFYYLTNCFQDGQVTGSILWSIYNSAPYSCRAIKLGYETKTTVVSVQWPTPRDTIKADKLCAKIAKLQAKLKELEG